MPYLGEFAALGTALCWTFTSMFFTEAGRLIGSFKVNNIRLLFAVIIYVVILTVTTGHIWPSNLNGLQFSWLALSGLIGLVIGDGFGFKALVMIGPRLTTLLWATAPIMVTIIAWVFLGEQLRFIDIVGIVVTVAGVAWVVSERKYKNAERAGVLRDHPDSGTRAKGVIYGLIAALGQGTGLVLSKQAMLYAGGSLEAFPAAFIRMLTSMVMIWIISGMRGQLGPTVKSIKNGKAMALAAGGAIMGPFLGVWLSLVAVRMINAGVAATLNSMTPVFVIPVVMFYYREKVSLRAFLGAVVAVSGVAVLLLT